MTACRRLVAGFLVPYGLGGEKTEGVVFENRCVALAFAEDSIFVVAEDNDSGFCAVWRTVLVGFNN